MSYTMHFDQWSDPESYDNLTSHLMLSDDEFIGTTDMYSYFADDYSDDKLGSEELLELFNESELFYQLSDEFIPLYNYVHILQSKPSDEQIRLAYEYCPSLSVIYSEQLDTHFIGLTCIGQDESSGIELAYYLLQQSSPIDGSADCFLGDDAKVLLNYCRTTYASNGCISIDSIDSFINRPVQPSLFSE